MAKYPGDDATGNAFCVGVNYWPARSAMSWWSHFDRAEVEMDFARIADAGCDSVRIFLTWEDFQPTPHDVDPVCVARLLSALDAANDVGLRVMPTLFVGHMSGVNWIPPWALGDATGDERFRVVAGGDVVVSRLASWYSDGNVGEAQVTLAAALATALRGHPALWAWDLGNENSNCGAAPDKASAREWLRRIADAIRSADTNAKITIGLHMEDLQQDRNMGPLEASEVCDFLTMHGYPGYASFTEGPTDERLLPFLSRLTARLGGDADVLFSEFGVPTQMRPEEAPQSSGPGPSLVSETEAAAYIDRALRSLHRCGSTGAMLWCHSDYSRDLFDKPPLDLAIHERSFGQWRSDGSPKPSIEVVRAFVDDVATLPPAQPLAHSTWFDIDVEQYYRAPETELPRLYQRYCLAETRQRNEPGETSLRQS